MKETIVQIMNNKMGKCTTEQFWAVAAITGLNAFLIMNSGVVTTHLAKWQIHLFIIVYCCYGIWFVVMRHLAFRNLHSDLVDYLQGENNLPAALKTKPKFWTFGSLSGVTFYSLIILATSLGAIFVIHKT